MADGTFPGLISKNRDLNAVDNVIYVQLSDGTAAVGVTGGALDVNIGNGPFTVTATNLDIRDLSQATDSVAIGDGTDIIAINADGSINITDNGGSITVDGTVSITGPVTVTATDLDIRDLDATQDNVAISDGTDTLAVNADGSINVNVVSAVTGGEIHDYNTATVAGSGTSNHDYTAVGTFCLSSIYVGASGDAKYEVQVDTGSGFNTIAVAFTTGKQGDSKSINFTPDVKLAATNVVRVIRTNRENTSQDLYSTIMGRET